MSTPNTVPTTCGISSPTLVADGIPAAQITYIFMEILEAFDLTGSFRAAADLAGAPTTPSPGWSLSGKPPATPPRSTRPGLIDEFLPKVEEWVDKSKGKIRADAAHEKLLAMGFTGSERTSRRAVAQVKASYRVGRVRVHRPWVTEPGLWLQYDFGDGPTVDGEEDGVVLRVVGVVEVPGRDRVAGPHHPDGVRRPGRHVPVGRRRPYLRADRQREVRDRRTCRPDPGPEPAGRGVRPALLGDRSHLPTRDPASKGGVENAVKLAKADIVPTDTNLADAYADFAALEVACAVFMGKVNNRVHSTTKRVPRLMLAEEALRLHPVPAAPHTVTFGETRTVAVNTPMVSYQGGSYSVPHQLLGETVWVRVHGAGRDERVVIVHVGVGGAVEVARHRRAEPGSPQSTTIISRRPRRVRCTGNPSPGSDGGGGVPGARCGCRAVVERSRRAGHLHGSG